jgi:hypothetical protein
MFTIDCNCLYCCAVLQIESRVLKSGSVARSVQGSSSADGKKPTGGVQDDAHALARPEAG